MRIVTNRLGRAAAALAVGMAASDLHATDGVVGPGNCNEAGFASVLATVDGSGGGRITFNCGNAATIAFTSYKTIANAVVVDGAGHVTFDGGSASPFLQIFASASVTLRGLAFQHGVFGDTHAIENFGTLTLDTVRVASNTSTESPVMNYGALTVRNSAFSGNAASDAGNGQGGAIANQSGFATVTGSTFEGNSATTGAAIYSTGPLTVVNSTFSANAATGGGGAIYQTTSGDASLAFLTVVGNSALFGAGIYNDGGGGSTMTIAASILSGNSTGNCDGVIQSGGYNLSSDTHCGGAFTGPGDVNGASLPMQPLADYGGPTETQPPQVGSAAVDHVPLAACGEEYDQRGGARPFGAACDSGAVELGAPVDLVFMDGFDG